MIHPCFHFFFFSSNLSWYSDWLNILFSTAPPTFPVFRIGSSGIVFRHNLDELVLHCIHFEQNSFDFPGFPEGVDRRSYERFGISPKLYLKLIRFSKACTIKEKFPGLSWTKIAYQSGYYDQNHFIKDFRQFIGITPPHSKENLINQISFRRHIE